MAETNKSVIHTSDVRLTLIPNDISTIYLDGNNITKKIQGKHLPFLKLNAYTSDLNKNIVIGSFRWYDENNTSKVYTPDTFAFGNKLNKLAEIVNEQSDTDVYDTWAEKLVKHDNLYDLLDLLGKYDVEKDNIISTYNKYTDMYDYDFSNYIYRAKEEKINTYDDNNCLTVKSPIFKVYTKNKDLKFNLIFRNIPIPMKKIELSSFTKNSIPMYSFVFIYPEYLFRQAGTNELEPEYILSLAYIEAENNDPSDVIFYDYLNSDDELYPISETSNIVTIGNLNNFVNNI